MGAALRPPAAEPLGGRLPPLLECRRGARSRRCSAISGRGLPAAEAARLALVETARRGVDAAGGGPARLGQLSAELRGSARRFDEPAAQTALDRLFAAFRLQTVLRDVVLPYLHELGLRWERGEASVAQEHFASNILRGRLLGLARGWAEAAGPRALLACAPGELHDLPLIGFGLALAARGWSITYLGPDTPIATIEETLRGREQTLVVISAMTARTISRGAGSS